MLAHLWFTLIISAGNTMATDDTSKQFNQLQQRVKRLKADKAAALDALATATGATYDAWKKELTTLNQELAAAKPELERLQRLMNHRN